MPKIHPAKDLEADQEPEMGLVINLPELETEAYLLTIILNKIHCNCLSLTHGRSIIRSANSGAPHPILRRCALLRLDRSSAAPVPKAACK